MTAVALTNAYGLMNPDGKTSADNDRVFRKFLAGLWLPDVNSQNPLAIRPGVIPHNWDTNGCTSLRVQQQATATMKVDVLAGPAILERSGQGPYPHWGESTVSPTIATSDPTNPRIDVVYSWVGDQSVNGSTDTLHGPVVDVLAGTPAATPSVPTALPDGAVPLAHVSVAANVTSITSADITDVRKSASLAFAVRHLLPGDSVGDPGRIDGELRYRQASGALPSLVDYWDAKQGLWRGQQGFALTAPFPGTPDGNGLVHGTLSSARTRIITLTVPDPGFPYRLGTYATLYHDNTAQVNYFVSVNSGPFSSPILTVNSAQWVYMTPNSDVIFTGSATVQLTGDLLSGGPGDWHTDQRNVMTVRVDPA